MFQRLARGQRPEMEVLDGVEPTILNGGLYWSRTNDGGLQNHSYAT